MNKAEKAVAQYELEREKAVLRKLERHYEYALTGINERLRMLQSAPETQSKVYQKQYQETLKKQVSAILERLHSDTYSSIDQYRHDAYTTGFVGTMYDLHSQDVPLLIPINQEAVLKAVQHDTLLTSPLYDELGIDTWKMSKSISKELSRGLASGLTYDDIARNIKNTTKAPLARAKLIARTEGHRIQQASAQDAREAAKERGAEVVKQWDATLDGDTRPNHRMLDGQIREVDEPFEVGSYTPMHPGDFGEASEDCNCRCMALTRARWAMDEDELKVLRERAVRHSLYADDPKAFRAAKLPALKSFPEFQKSYLKAAQTLDNSGKSGIIDAGGTLDSFNRKQHYTDSTEDLVKTNPNYGKSVEYRVNCQRCVPAYELRRRGYDVQAKPAFVTARGRLSSKDPICQNSKWFKGIFSGIQWKICPSGSGVYDIKQTMAKWGDGARAEVYVMWKNGDAHVFVAEQVNGKTVFYDPQSGSPDYEKAFGTVKNGLTMFARIDNLQVTDAIKDCVENAR